MNLYHFTNWLNYAEIARDARITPTESNIGSGLPELLPFGQHVGPDVVWLSEKATPGAMGLEQPPELVAKLEEAYGLPYVVLDKRNVRLTVELPDEECHRWPAWALAHGINRKWQRKLEADMMPWTWWVIERPVALTEVVETVASPELAEYLESDGVTTDATTGPPQ